MGVRVRCVRAQNGIGELQRGCAELRTLGIGRLVGRLTDARHVSCAVGDGLVQINVTVADFDIEPAIGVAANPCLVVNGRALASKV